MFLCLRFYLFASYEAVPLMTAFTSTSFSAKTSDRSVCEMSNYFSTLLSSLSGYFFSLPTLRFLPYSQVFLHLFSCSEQTPFPLCGTCYHSLIAAKITALELKNNYGTATYNAGSKLVVYPDKVPADRMPSNIKRVRGGVAGN